jgi:hypothetical protein
VQASKAEADTEHIGAGNEREEPEPPARIGEVLDHRTPVGDQPPAGQRHQHNEPGAAHAYQPRGQDVEALKVHPDGQDPRGHHQREVARRQSLDSPDDAITESFSHARSFARRGARGLGCRSH